MEDRHLAGPREPMVRKSRRSCLRALAELSLGCLVDLDQSRIPVIRSLLKSMASKRV